MSASPCVELGLPAPDDVFSISACDTEIERYLLRLEGSQAPGIAAAEGRDAAQDEEGAST